jgi:hypothetical protein
MQKKLKKDIIAVRLKKQKTEFYQCLDKKLYRKKNLILQFIKFREWYIGKPKKNTFWTKKVHYNRL